MFREGYINSFKRVITARFLAFISSLIRKYLYLKNFFNFKCETIHILPIKKK